MKKLKVISVTLILLLMITTTCYAAIDNTIHFDISYEGEIKVNEEKNTLIILAGDNTPLHAKVRVKIDIEGPTTPKLLATDSLGTQIDIANWGYWGPETGFAIQGTFTNETPVKATFTQSGLYTIKLSLIDIENANDVLAQKTVTIQVRDSAKPVENIITNETINEPIEELPKTGTSLMEYAIYAIVFCMVTYCVYKIREIRK